MAILIDQYTLSQDSTFQHRCQQAALEVANSVMAEADTVAFHFKRAAFAREVISNPGPIGVMFAAALAAVAAVGTAAGTPPNQTSVSDALIRSVVTAGWDSAAGSRVI